MTQPETYRNYHLGTFPAPTPDPVVCFLQNAWSWYYAGAAWPRDSWLQALADCKSGQKLLHLINDHSCVENANPLCGYAPNVTLPADDRHISAVLKFRMPKVVIACGKVAEAALTRLWPGALLVVPHPASRTLTNALYQHGKRLWPNMTTERLALRQMIGTFRWEIIPAANYSPKVA